MEKFIINCTLNVEEEVEIIAKNENEAYEIAKDIFFDKLTNQYLDNEMDFEVLEETDLTRAEYVEYWR